MKELKKKLALLLAVGCSVALLAGCAGSGQNAGAAAETASAVPAVSEEGTAAPKTADESETDTALETASAEEEAADSESLADGSTADASEVSGTDDETVVRVGGLKGPTTMGLVKLMEDAQNGVSQNEYEFTMVTAADELTGLVASGKVDIALLPANVAAILYQKTEGNVAVIDINTLGVIYLVSADTSITSMEQLKGRTVYLPGKGTTPEYAFRYLIEAAGLSEDDVTLEFKSEATEVASILAEDPDAIGLLPQPFVTSALSQNEALSVIMDLTQVWDSYQTEENPSRLVTGVTIVNAGFLEAHQALVDTFLQEHEASVRFTAEDPEAAASLIEQAGIVAKAQIAQKALPYCNITFIAGDDLKDVLEGYLSALLAQDPSSVGGALPDNAFYYIP